MPNRCLELRTSCSILTKLTNQVLSLLRSSLLWTPDSLHARTAAHCSSAPARFRRCMHRRSSLRERRCGSRCRQVLHLPRRLDDSGIPHVRGSATTADGARRLGPLELFLTAARGPCVETRVMRLQHQTVDHRCGHVEAAAVAGFFERPNARAEARRARRRLVRSSVLARARRG